MEKEQMKEKAQNALENTKKATKSFLSLDKEILMARVTEKMKTSTQTTYYGLLFLIVVLFFMSLFSGIFTFALAVVAVALARLVCEYIKASAPAAKASKAEKK